MSNYTVKEIMQKYSISKRTLQYYDSIGLLNAKRNEHNHRVYDEEGCYTLQCILMCRECGMTLDETADVMQKYSSDKAIQNLLKNKRKQLQEDLQNEEQKLTVLRGLQKFGFKEGLAKTKSPVFNNYKLKEIQNNFTLAHMLILLFLLFDAVVVIGIIYEMMMLILY